MENENGLSEQNLFFTASRPKLCLQPNQISQGFYHCTPMAKKLLAYTIAELKVIRWHDNPNKICYQTTFTVSDFIKALGLQNQKQSANQKEIIRNALLELQKSCIAIDIAKDTGKEFHTFSWVNHSCYSEDEKKICIDINDKLGEALIQIQKGYTELQLLTIGKLKSLYALRFYELGKSYAGFEGKNGNEKGEWFIDLTVEQIRKMFVLGKEDYKGRMTNFITNVIKQPLDEVSKKTDLLMSFEKAKEGRNITGFRFTCKWKTEPVKIKKTEPKAIKKLKEEIKEEMQEVERIKNDPSLQPVWTGCYEQAYDSYRLEGKTEDEAMRAATVKAYTWMAEKGYIKKTETKKKPEEEEQLDLF